MKNDPQEFTQCLKEVSGYIFAHLPKRMTHDSYHLQVALAGLTRIAREHGLIEECVPNGGN